MITPFGRMITMILHVEKKNKLMEQNVCLMHQRGFKEDSY